MKLNNKISSTTLIIIAAFFLMLFGNFAFINNVKVIYPFSVDNSVFLFSLFIFFSCVNVMLLSLVCFKRTVKPILIMVMLMSSLAAYFMDAYNVVIDDLMIDNIVKTDANEAFDLLSIKQLLYFLLIGVFPSVIIYKAEIIESPFRKAVLSQVILFFSALLLSAVLIFSLSDFYASFFREHKALRFYANPSYYIYSGIKYVNSFFETGFEPLREMGLDALIPPSDERRELIIFVVGETARADHFSLNGYDKKTNPLLEQEDVISFDNVWSCGTSTMHSVPCMFSFYGRSDFTRSKGASTENALDILKHAGINVIWFDNNSSSKGVADRVSYEDYKSSKSNPNCDIECRDEGMLANLQAYIDSHSTDDIFIVLHQMGNHGPAYYRRYPKEYERFTPTCQTNQLEKCTQEEIKNTYDNALLYTDYFLSQTIQLLKSNDDEFETALLYVSDHGESLGENNLYLHGLPYMFAPDAQVHVPMIMWFGSSFEEREINLIKLKEQAHKKLSHDNLFHTILGLMEVQSEIYDKNMDIIER
jgi:lipid A ethanolaminephosphotransferase